MNTWQPIETAPRDGTDILLCRMPEGFILIDCWNHDRWDDWKYKACAEPPTHWMPMPELPLRDCTTLESGKAVHLPW